MRFDVNIGARRRVVEIAAQPGGVRASIDGVARDVDAVRAGGGWSLLIAHPAGGGSRRSRHVTLSPDGNGGWRAHVGGRLVPLTIERADRVDWRRRATTAGQDRGANGPHRVVSPMPGRIVKVLAAAGDTVAARQGLVVVEAMKMENELRAPRAGVVTDVRVQEGSLVEANAVLMVLD